MTRRKRRFTRRSFLKVLGIGGAGLVIGIKLATPAIRLKLAEVVEASGGPSFIPEGGPLVWFEVNLDESLCLFVPKVEMGQGVHTAFAQIAAEELEYPFERLIVKQAGTGMGLDDPAGTAASNSVSSLYKPLREVAATLREMLRGEAARQLGATPEQLVLMDGVFTWVNSPQKTLTFGQVVAGHSGEWQIPKAPPRLKSTDEFRYIGVSMKRKDLPDKVTGKAIFGYDVRLPGMLYGAILRPPTLQGKLLSANVDKAQAAPGVIKAVVEGDFAGVAAESRTQAYAALELFDAQWDQGKLWQHEQLEALVTVGIGDGVSIQKEGDTSGELKKGELISAEYRTPFALHAHLEPQAATADVQGDQVKVWASTQSAVRLQGRVAKILGLKEEKVIVTPTYLGGGFGRKVGEEAAVEAARLSAAAGHPVQIAWTRTEDFRNGFLRPPTHHILNAVLDQNGHIQAMEHLQASGAVAFPFLPDAMEIVLGADFGAWRGALIPYEVPNKHVKTWLLDLPVPTGWWRGLGLLPNIFALESFVDELAHYAGIDPLEFRLINLPDDELGERMRRVLDTAAQLSGWGKQPPGGQGMGIAVCYDARTVIAEVAQVSLINQAIKVERVYAAVDPGLAVNPDGIASQTQGAVTMGASAALLEQVIIKEGVIQPANFGDYPLLRNADAPVVEVVVLESGKSPFGMGEPPIGPIAAAIANAVVAAGGPRLRLLPLRLQD